MVCGPTASGKSELSDALAERLAELHGDDVPTIVVDSMQVYKELPMITNQARRRPAELVGIVSVTEEWTVARHKACAVQVAAGAGTRFVLDAGTGMYLNAILLDLPLSPKVPPRLRRLAEDASRGTSNPRRAARAKELELAGVAERASIWSGNLLYDTAIVYLRPERTAIDAAIEARSERIACDGIEEAGTLKEMAEAGATINQSVLQSVGVRELTQYLSGGITLHQAQDQINTRTRKLARRQMRWFDKLARTLEGRATIRVVENMARQDLLHIMHDIIDL